MPSLKTVERSGESPAGRPENHLKHRLRAEEGQEVGLTHPDTSVLRWGWSRGSRQPETQAALRYEKWLIPSPPATRLKSVFVKNLFFFLEIK